MSYPHHKIEVSKERQTKMTKYAKNMLKGSILSLALSTITTLLAMNAYTNKDEWLSAYSSLGAFVIGAFALIGVVATLVYLFVGDEG